MKAVPLGRPTLASHPLQLLKVSEQLLIAPEVANEIITARHWEPLPSPTPAGQALAPTRFRKHLGHPHTASLPSARTALCPAVMAAGLGELHG